MASRTRRHARRVVTAVLLCSALLSSGCTAERPGPQPGTVVGQVVGLGGEPVAGAEVTADGNTVRTDERGGFTIGTKAPASWVTVSHPGYIGRTRAGVAGDPLLVRLTPDDGETVSLLFGGDVMMGRRFFDRDEDGSRDDAIITDPADVAEHRALLEPIAPLLGSADLTAVNVESPVADEPVVDASRPRRPGVHPTKSFVFASGPALPGALAEAGVDVVGLANNHQYDLLADGVRTTVDRFAEAGFAPGSRQFGLGDSVDAAYVPAVTQVGGTRIAFLGCTTITGGEHDIGYVAGPDRGGAAPCTPARVRDAVAAAAADGSLVVFSVHGGYEYGREPSDGVRRISAIARQAGARLVIDHHPHVVGGLDWDGTGLTAWSLGNLVFDQTVWPTFQSYVLVVHVRRGTIVRAYLEPLLVEDYVTHGLGSGSADQVARTTAGLSRGPFVVEDGALELRVGAPPPSTPVPVRGSAAGRIDEIGDGWLLERADPAGTQSGTDLLWVGDFAEDVVGGEPGALWTQGPDSGPMRDEDAGRGQVYRLHRDDGDVDPVTGSTIHRLLLTNPGSAALRRAAGSADDEDAAAGAPPVPGSPRADAEVSLTGLVRLSPGARAEVRLSWYPDTRGPSSTQTVQVVEGGPAGAWQPVRLDASAPPDAVAVGVTVELSPPLAVPGRPAPPSEVTADVDALRVIEWSPRGAPPSRGATHLRTFADGTVQLSRTGGAEGEVPPPLAEIAG